MSNEWWNTAPGGAKGSVDGSERLPAESGSTGYTILISQIKTYIQAAFGSVFEALSNKVTAFQATPDDTHYASEKLVKDSLDEKLNITDLSATINIYATTAASDLGGGYLTLVTDIDDPDYDTVAVDVNTGVITTTSQLLASLASAAGIIVGNPGIINITTAGNIKRVSGVGTAEFYFEVYHRTSGGVETLIATSSTTAAVSSSTYTQFFASALLNDGAFTATDRVVLKFYANRISGATDPTYNFQFGGSLPVRTILPVPAAVIPHPAHSELANLDYATSGHTGFAADSNESIEGQYDIWQSFTPTNGQTVTINYLASNSAKIDISALGTGDSITIAVSNWPTSANNGMVSISMKTGADPDVTISWPTGVVAPTLEASKNNRFVLASNFDSSGYDLMSAGAF